MCVDIHPWPYRRILAILSSCFAINQTNAQPEIWEGIELKPLIYEADGVQYYGIAEVVYHAIYKANLKNWVLNWNAQGPLVEAAKILDDGTLDWLDYIPLPKSTVKAYDPRLGYYEKITVNPNGMVLVNTHLPVFYKFDL